MLNTQFPNGQAVFDPESTAAMAAVLQAVCEALNIPPEANAAREVVAGKIVELARRGERDPGRLRDRLLRENGKGT